MSNYKHKHILLMLPGVATFEYYGKAKFNNDEMSSDCFIPMKIMLFFFSAALQKSRVKQSDL